MRHTKSALLTLLCLLATLAAAQTKPVVVFIATGGTIAMKIDPVKHAPVPAISGEDLLATVPEVSTPLRRQHVTLKSDNMPYVEIVPMYGGADGYLVKAALDHGAKGVVIQGLGWGNVNKPMYAAIKDAIAKGVPVVITSRVPNGRVLPNYGFEGGGKTLVELGAVMGDDLSPQKARILLMLLLQDGVTGQKNLQAAFDR